MALKTLVMLGALLQVLVKGAKFSLFKPAEEMVYIGLDDESRSKGDEGSHGSPLLSGSLPSAWQPRATAVQEPQTAALPILLTAEPGRHGSWLAGFTSNAPPLCTGKAAIDVVGAQSGKSASSLLQQTLLLLR